MDILAFVFQKICGRFSSQPKSKCVIHLSSEQHCKRLIYTWNWNYVIWIISLLRYCRKRNFTVRPRPPCFSHSHFPYLHTFFFSSLLQFVYLFMLVHMLLLLVFFKLNFMSIRFIRWRFSNVMKTFEVRFSKLDSPIWQFIAEFSCRFFFQINFTSLPTIYRVWFCTR